MNKPEKKDYDSSYQYEQDLRRYKNYMEKKTMVKVGFGIVGAVVAVIVALTVFGGSWYTIDQGERGVILRNGAITGTADAGLGFKIPIVDSVVKITTQTQSKLYTDVATYSRDQQPAILILSVTYQLPADRVEEIYAQYGGEDGLVNRLVDRQVNEAIRTVFGRFNAAEAVQQRERLAMEFRIAVQAAVQGPVNIVSTQIENIDFSDAYEESIEQRMLAEVEVQRIQQNAEREKVQAEIRVIQAQAEAEARVAQATAEAEAITLTGDAEASAIRARGAALRDNPSLINLVQAERWNGTLPTTMVPGGTVPFMNMN